MINPKCPDSFSSPVVFLMLSTEQAECLLFENNPAKFQISHELDKKDSDLKESLLRAFNYNKY